MAELLPWTTRERFVDVATVAYLAMAAACAKTFDLPFILFPELAALTFVVFAKPQGPWARSPLKLVLTPSLAGLVGLVVIHVLPYSLASVALVTAASVTVLLCLRSPVVPAISAGLLPLVFGIGSPSYLIALVIALGGLAAAAAIRRRWHLLLPEGDDLPSPPPPAAAALATFALFVVLGYAMAVVTSMRLVLYPPLVVAAYQMIVLAERCPWTRQPGTLVIACSLCAIGGYVAFHLLGRNVSAVVAAAAFAILVLRQLDLLVPPALAVALIPWLIDKPTIGYPIAIALGTAVLSLVSLASRAIARRFADTGERFIAGP